MAVLNVLYGAYQFNMELKWIFMVATINNAIYSLWLKLLMSDDLYYLASLVFIYSGLFFSLLLKGKSKNWRLIIFFGLGITPLIIKLISR